MFLELMSDRLLVNEEGLVTTWNPNAEAIFGWTSEAMVNKPLGDLIVPLQDRATSNGHRVIFQNMGGGFPLDTPFESEGRHRDGRRFPIEMSVTAIESASGRLFSTFVRDVTERKQEERNRSMELQITRLLLEATSLEAVAQDILRTICDLLEWKVGVLWKVDEEMDVLRYVGEWKTALTQTETFCEQTRRSDFPRGVGLPGRVWERGTVQWIADVTHDNNFPRASSAEADGLRSAVAFPIKCGGDVLAVMEFFSDAVRVSDKKLLDLLESVAGQISQFLARRAAEQALMRSEARFSGILQLADDAIVSIDDSGRIVLFNQGAQRIFGYAADEVLGQPLDLLIPDQLREAHRRHVRRFRTESTIARSKDRRREIKGRRKNGEEFPAEASIARVTVEGQTTYTAILRDISQRKQEEQALRDAKAMAEQLASEKHALLATVEVCFIRLTQAGVVREWTGKAEKLLDIPLTEAIGQSLYDLPIGWNWRVVQDAVKQVVDTTGTVRLAKVPLTMQGGEVRFLKLTVSPLCQDSGVDVVIMGEDITDYLSLEHDLVQAQKLEAIGQLAAGVAHEINTPTQFVGDNLSFLSGAFTDILTVLARYRELLASAKAGSCAPALIEACEAESRRADLDYLIEEIPKAVAQSSEGMDRVAKIVRAMKDFAHPSGDDKICVDLNRAIESTATVARHEWKYVADLTTDLADDLPLVPCLVDQINQVILNLIVNASHAIADTVKDTGQKGTITITTRRVGEWAEIRVTDTGAGIPENIRDKIFEPFFTTKEVGKGTGQGLTIARSVVADKHQGTITFDSQVGKGTTFVIRLPLKEQRAPQAVREAA